MKKSLTISLLIFLFSSCTTKYSNPYSARNVANDLEERYSTEIEIVATKKAGFFEGNKHNRYLMKDKNRGFLFEAGSYVAMDKHIPLHERNRWDKYPLGLMRHYHDDALKLADKHKIKLVPPQLTQLEADFFSDTHLYATATDSVFIHSNEELGRVADLYIELAHLYNLTYEGSLPYNFPELTLSYALPQNQDSTVRICRLPYLSGKIETSPPRFNRRIKNIYINYIPEKHIVYNKLYDSWNDAVSKGLISQEKAQYKQYESRVFGLIDYDEESKGYSAVTYVSGEPVIAFFQLADPNRLSKNILTAESLIADKLYNNHIQKAFPTLDKELEQKLSSNGEPYFGQVHLKKESLTEQFPLYSIIVRSDGSAITCYKIPFTNDVRLILISTNIDGEYMGGGVICSVSLSLFSDPLISLTSEDFNSIYSIYSWIPE